MEGKKVVIKPLKDKILDLKGSVKAKGKPIDFRKLRIETKKKLFVKLSRKDN